MTRPGFALLLLILVYAALLFADRGAAFVKQFSGHAAAPSPSDLKSISHSASLTETGEQDHE